MLAEPYVETQSGAGIGVALRWSGGVETASIREVGDIAVNRNESVLTLLSDT